MKPWQSTLLQLLLGIFIGIIFSSIVYMASRPPRGRPVELLPAATPGPLLVQVAGEVTSPGLYELPAGSRVQDAVLAAGGFTASANQTVVNLAARLKDGDKVTVLAEGEEAVAGVSVQGQSSGQQSSSKQAAVNVTFPLDLNTATLEELDALPGIGPGRAQEIIRYREEHGGFKTVEELKEVSGIGDVTYSQLKDSVTVSPGP